MHTCAFKSAVIWIFFLGVSWAIGLTSHFKPFSTRGISFYGCTQIRHISGLLLFCLYKITTLLSASYWWSISKITCTFLFHFFYHSNYIYHELVFRFTDFSSIRQSFHLSSFNAFFLFKEDFPNFLCYSRILRWIVLLSVLLNFACCHLHLRRYYASAFDSFVPTAFSLPQAEYTFLRINPLLGSTQHFLLAHKGMQCLNIHLQVDAGSGLWNFYALWVCIIIHHQVPGTLAGCAELTCISPLHVLCRIQNTLKSSMNSVESQIFDVLYSARDLNPTAPTRKSKLFAPFCYISVWLTWKWD